jgi:hypothetical protein
VDVILWTHVLDYENLSQLASILRLFLRVPGVPVLLTSSSFIGFWHISNGWKA